MSDVQSGTIGDREAAAAFWATVSENPDRSEDHLGRSYFEGSGTLFAIARAEGEIVGLAVGTQARVSGDSQIVLPGVLHINKVFVLPSHRNRGIARALVERLIGDGRDRGYDRFQLWVHTNNAIARRLYERLGLQAEGQAIPDARGNSIIRYVR